MFQGTSAGSVVTAVAVVAVGGVVVMAVGGGA